MTPGHRAVAVTFAILVVAGCAGTEPPPPPPPPVSQHPGARLVVGSPELLGRVVIADPTLRKRGPLTEAVVTVQNLTEGTYTLEYLFEWEDDRGFTVDQVRVWQQFTLTPYQILKVSSTGPAPEASAILFTIRAPLRRL